ncbi:MAG: DUF2264 domain-containing protein [Clostridia bacterium]|nr:DUF2264 domain-containing protein [Clostridia bacterium]
MNNGGAHKMNTRRYWLDTMLRIGGPVLRALAEDRLRETLPVESKSPREDRAQYTYLEAFGRTLVGMAPWLELEGLTGEEAALQAEYRELVRRGLHNAVTPGARDCMNFSVGHQPIVDAAFLAHAILRAPTQLWTLLPEDDRRNLVNRMKETRTRLPYRCNWLLFAAMIECFLHMAGNSLGEDSLSQPMADSSLREGAFWDPMRVDYAVRQHFDWYKGDGFFGDGPDFHMDYYNSYVIQPMLIDVLRAVGHMNGEWQRLLPRAERYGARYAQFLENLISPDGSYPVLGRSSAYRFGCFQMLAQAMLQKLPETGLSPAQVRCGLTAVIRRVMAFDNFDGDGFLRIGVCGSQPDMGEPYISTGSLYLCTAVFLPLGLPETDEFWSAPDEMWTQAKMWRGAPMTAGHSI